MVVLVRKTFSPLSQIINESSSELLIKCLVRDVTCISYFHDVKEVLSPTFQIVMLSQVINYPLPARGAICNVILLRIVAQNGRQSNKLGELRVPSEQ